MSDTEFTFFEFHFHDRLQLGPRTISTGGDAEAAELTEGTEPAEEAEPTESADASESSGPGVIGPLLGLGALAGLAYAVKKLLAGADAEGFDALDDIEADVEAATEGLQEEAEDSVPIEITEPEEETGGVAGIVVAALLGLLVVAAVLRKLLGGSEEIVVEE